MIRKERERVGFGKKEIREYRKWVGSIKLRVMVFKIGFVIE